MITIEHVCARFRGLDAEEVRRWIAEGHVRADRSGTLEEIDVERIRLILDLRDIFEVNDAALPLVLQLLDEVYALRRLLSREAGEAALSRRWRPPPG